MDNVINSTIKFFRETWIYMVVLLLVLLIKIFVVTPVRINGTSMNPTLHDGDIMILNKIAYKSSDIKRFDIVVIYLNDKLNNEKLIKRVIGLPGDSIEYKNNKLYVNGKYVKEDFDHTNTEDFDLSLISATTVPRDSYFVVGDNREVSADSRVIGFVSKDEIAGRVSYTIFPFNRIGTKK